MVTSFHHVGCLVENIQEAIEDYKILYPGGEISPTYVIDGEGVSVCFFNIGATNIEFVQPDEQSALYKMLRKNLGFYHIAVFTNDIHAEIERLEAQGYRSVNLFRSAAFNGRYCAYLHNNEMHLIELIEEEK